MILSCAHLTRFRKYVQGTYVEGIKEEVVLSPGHALSFIAAGEGYIVVYCMGLDMCFCMFVCPHPLHA